MTAHLLTGAGVIAVLTNGVEVLSYQARDKVFLGPVDGVDVASGGQNYSANLPPSLIVDRPALQVGDQSVVPAGIATQALVTPVVKGKLEKILIDPQDFNINEVFSINVVGGNSPGATATPKIETKRRRITFDARKDEFGGGVNPTDDSILFQKDHNLSPGQAVFYDNDGFNSVNIVNDQGDVVKLANGGKYYVGILNSRTIQLYPTENEYRAGINTIGISSVGATPSSGTQTFTTEPKKSLIGADIVEDGGDFYYRSMQFVESNVFVSYDEVRYPNHGFTTGDRVIYEVKGTSIDPLVDGTEYYIISKDADTIQFCEVGPDTDPEYNLRRKEIINLLDAGDSSSVFNIRYPDVRVEVVFSTDGGVNGSITATPYVRGEISQVYVNDGSFYGTDILNFEKSPNIAIKKGQLARIQPVIINGEIVSVQILSKGRFYPSDAEIVVEDKTGSGIGAVLRGVIVDGELEDIVIINGGQSYSQNAQLLTVVDPSEDAILIARIRDLTVNLQSRFGFESLEDNQYRIVSYDRQIRENVYNDFGGSHSPIVGWANDGNPIYGGFGLDIADDFNSGFRALKTAYDLKPENVYGRPSLQKYLLVSSSKTIHLPTMVT